METASAASTAPVEQQRGDELAQALAERDELVATLQRVQALRAALLDALTAQGLERRSPEGEVFDPSEQQAVEQVPGDDPDAQPLVQQVLRAGYRWRGRLLRPAMVTVRG